MTSRCWASVRGEVARFTALDNCCTPVDAACGVVTTDGFISVVLTQELEAAQVITVKNAADRVCTYDPGCDSILDLQAVVTLCKVNPELLSMMTGQEVVLDYAGVAVGTRRSSTINCDLRFSLELWTNVPGTACVGTPPVKQYGYFLVPCLRSAVITGDITIDGANAISLELTAKTSIPSNWGTGPDTADQRYYVVAADVDNTPSLLLSAIGPTDHDHMQLTTIAPPSVSADCGCEPLDVLPLGPAVLTAVNPNTGLLAAGGQTITVTGFSLTGATAVKFGVTSGTGLVVVNDNSLTVVSPAKTAGTYPLTVVSPGGTSNAINVTFV